MHVVYSEWAETEYHAAVGQLRADGLRVARAFVEDLEAAERLIVQLPQAHPRTYAGCRRILLSTFPYQLVYRVEADLIRVYAVAHLKRRPGYWRERLTP